MIVDNIVLLPLRSPLQLVFLSDTPITISVDNLEFTRSDTGDITGFYDWLRKDGRIVGIGVLIFEDFHFLLSTFLGLEYVTVEKQTTSGAVLASIHFYATRNYEDDKSNDQLFAKNYLYKTSCGEFGLTFQLPDSAEYDALKTSWLGFRSIDENR
jgi:hypothetical protein